ncbi:MAG: hypothetical protein FWF59_14475 [Turicibacter sp.]|nr:hypothetical protein [Turicibacter sp.]
MLKKLMVRASLAVFLLSGAAAGWNSSYPIQGIAVSAATKEELEKEISDAAQKIAELEKEEATIRVDVEVLDNDLATILERIAELEASLEKAEARVLELDAEIEVIRQQLGLRLELSQRLSHSNVILNVLESSDGLLDLIRNFRFIADQANIEADLIGNLTALVEEQQALLETNRQPTSRACGQTS